MVLLSIEVTGLANTISSLSLSFVFYILNFSFSLPSVCKITRALNCLIKLYPIVCEFQKLETKKMIGTGNEKDGLYYLDLISKQVACSSSFSLFDHHCQLCHPSIGLKVSVL